MNESNVSRSSVVWKYGITGAMLMMILPLLLFILNANVVDYRILLSLLNIAILAVIIGIGVFNIREQSLGGYMSIRQGMANGLLIAIVISLLYAVFNVIYYKLLAAGFVTDMFESTRQQLEDQGIPTSDIEMSMKFTKAVFSIPGVIISTFITFGLLGGIISGFMAFVFQKYQK